MLDIDPHEFRFRFQLCPPQVLNPRSEGGTPAHFARDLEDLEKISFLKSSFVTSQNLKYHPWYILMLPQLSMHIMAHFQEH